MSSPQTLELQVRPVTQASRPFELMAQEAETEHYEQEARTGDEGKAQHDADREQHQPDDDPDQANGVM
jgi:hypothetical protein